MFAHQLTATKTMNSRLFSVTGRTPGLSRFRRSLSSSDDIAVEGEWAGCKRSFMAPLRVSARGADILYNPLYNKGTAFKSGERDRLGFRGMLQRRLAILVRLLRFC